MKPKGYYRARKGTGFMYSNERGHTISAAHIRQWIESLAIPPAWQAVWISKDKAAYLLATGYDAKGRKQYIYHPEAETIRESKKLERLILLGKALPKIKRRISRDVKLSGLPKERVLAAVLQLILETGIRVGNEQYKDNGTYGATTLRKKHVSGKTKKTFSFVGKSGVDREVSINDDAVVSVIKKCEDAPGLELFKYIDEAGEKQDVTSDDVNDYIRIISGSAITAKDFRTWYGSVAALETCITLGKCQHTCEQTHMRTIFKHAAEVLGNTPKIAAESYVHESVIAAHKASVLKTKKTTNKNLTDTEMLFISILTSYEASV